MLRVAALHAAYACVAQLPHTEPLLIHPTRPSVQAGNAGDHRHGAEHSAPLAPAGGVHHSLTGAAAYLQATYVSPVPVLPLYCTCIVVSYPEGWLAYCAMSSYCRWTPS
jgi:hypothetical protein